VEAIDPGAIDESGAFERRLEGYLDQVTGAETVSDAPGRVLVPGEPEAEAERRADDRGIVIDERHHRSLVEIGEQLGLQFPVDTV